MKTFNILYYYAWRCWYSEGVYIFFCANIREKKMKYPNYATKLKLIQFTTAAVASFWLEYSNLPPIKNLSIHPDGSRGMTKK